mgnify:CR=1 FL=1
MRLYTPPNQDQIFGNDDWPNTSTDESLPWVYAISDNFNIDSLLFYIDIYDSIMTIKLNYGIQHGIVKGFLENDTFVQSELINDGEEIISIQLNSNILDGFYEVFDLNEDHNLTLSCVNNEFVLSFKLLDGNVDGSDVVGNNASISSIKFNDVLLDDYNLLRHLVEKKYIVIVRN